MFFNVHKKGGAVAKPLFFESENLSFKNGVAILIITANLYIF